MADYPRMPVHRLPLAYETDSSKPTITSPSARNRVHFERSKRYAVVGLLAGILCGFLACLWSKAAVPCTECCLKKQIREEIQHEMDSERQRMATRPPERKKVLVGVMTAAKFLDSRAKAVWNTWASTINGDVIFFSSEGSETQSDLPLVALPGVTDAYPPQKKSFMMIKYLHDYGVGRYDYFMRVDDDVYIHGERLDKFLSTLNHSERLYIGQAGTGNAEELGRLSLGLDENFCMGGPGIVFSEETVKSVVPHISYCLQNLLTSHEDVELGRCVRMFAGVACTWSYEMQKLFYHSYTYRTERHVFPYVMSGPEMDRAITLHPVKAPEVMYELHNKFSIFKNAELQKKQQMLTEELERISHLLEGSEKEEQVVDVQNETIPWTYVTSKTQYSHNMFSLRRNHEGPWKSLLTKAAQFILSHYNENALSAGRILERPEIIYGFRRWHPTLGIELKLNMKMIYQTIRGKSTKTIVSKMADLQIPFGATEIRELPLTASLVHLVMPLSGKLNEFKRFMTQFELLCGRKELCNLLVILYRGSAYDETIDVISNSKYKHLIHVIEGQGSFSRAVALHQAMVQKKDGDLIAFIDVDIHLDSSALTRMSEHTIFNKQVYFPVVFNQYDSQMTCGRDSCPVEDNSANAGFFRFFGFGIVSLYRADYFMTGGFDLNIQGWGKEDVDLYVKVLRSGLTVFRAADPGIIHIYHPKTCTTSLNSDQTVMCLNSKAASFSSKENLAKIYFRLKTPS